MEWNHIYLAVQKELPEIRFEHTIRVVETAKKLAERGEVSAYQVEVSGLLHDYCKYWSKEKLWNWMKQANYPSWYLAYHKVWHGFVGAEVARTSFSVRDDDILNAIRYHTSGRKGMSFLEKIIYLADYIEPNRSFPGIDEVREVAQVNIDQAVLKAMDQTITSLIKRKHKVFPLTLDARNDMLDYVYTKHLKEESF